MNLEVKKMAQGPVLAKGGGGSVRPGCSAGYCGPTTDAGSGQVSGGYNPKTGTSGVGYQCQN